MLQISRLVAPHSAFWFVATGSPSSWVTSIDCTSSECSRHKKYDASISTTYKPHGTSFASLSEWGLVQGHISIDSAQVGDLVVKQQSFGEAINVSSPFTLAGFDGVLGMGFAQSTGDVQNSLFQNSIGLGLLDAPLFSLFLAKGDMTKNSEILFGGIDAKHFTGALIEIPVRNHSMLWELELDALAFGQDVMISDDYTVTFDSMPSYIRMPSNIVAYL